MFCGESAHTLDAKKRCVIPRRFQASLGFDADGNQRAVLTRGFERCLFLFPEASFEGMLERFQTQPFVGAEMRKMQRLFFANTHRAQLDGSGRLLLPEKLRSYAGIEREVIIVGVADRAEIWDRATWEQYEAQHEDQYDELDAVLAGKPDPVDGD